LMGELILKRKGREKGSTCRQLQVVEEVWKAQSVGGGPESSPSHSKPCKSTGSTCHALKRATGIGNMLKR
jgi:hypothetical protein